jgi:epoxyqueuosine reductase
LSAFDYLLPINRLPIFSVGDNVRVTETAISTLVRQAARDAGFDLAGIAPVREFRELEYFPEWIANGHAGEMRYLESRDDQGQLKRSSLSRMAPWARSVIVCALNYNTAQPYSTEPAGSDKGWVSRYAWFNGDYHDHVMKRLRHVETKLRESAVKVETRCYVDTGPIVERIYAKYAGLGWIGKNTCIINQRIGSWLFLGVILTSLELTPDLPAPDRCGTCTRCIDACPTNAFTAPHQMDASRCIAYLTIEKRGDVPVEFRDQMGRQVFGCDICQDVCPWNRKAPGSSVPEFQPRAELVNPALDWLATITEENFRETFRGSPVKRTKRQGLRRNSVLAMASSGDQRFAPVLEGLANDDDPTVAEYARWALQQLRRKVQTEVTKA